MADLDQATEDAQFHIWCSLQEHLYKKGQPPTIEAATEIVKQGARILLKEILGAEEPLENHVHVRLEDQSGGEGTKVAIFMESKSEAGSTLVHLFGLPSADPVLA